MCCTQVIWPACLPGALPASSPAQLCREAAVRDGGAAGGADAGASHAVGQPAGAQPGLFGAAGGRRGGAGRAACLLPRNRMLLLPGVVLLQVTARLLVPPAVVGRALAPKLEPTLPCLCLCLRTPAGGGGGACVCGRLPPRRPPGLAPCHCHYHVSAAVGVWRGARARRGCSTHVRAQWLPARLPPLLVAHSGCLLRLC